MSMAGPFSSGAAVGAAGSALSNADSTIILVGKIMAIYVEYVGSPPSTTDAVIKSKGTSPAPPTYTFLTLTNKNTSGWFYPHVLIDDVLGVDIAAEYTPQMIHDLINVSIDGANAADSVNVWFLLSPY